MLRVSELLRTQVRATIDMMVSKNPTDWEVIDSPGFMGTTERLDGENADFILIKNYGAKPVIIFTS
jgi:hypothetical protein